MSAMTHTGSRGELVEPAFMRRIRLRAQRRALWMRNYGTAELAFTEQRLAIAHAEVDRILAGIDQQRRAEILFYAEHPLARQLGPAIELADRAWQEDKAWSRVRKAFALSEPELDLLALTVAVEIDPMLRRAYGYLNDDATACYPTPWLAASVFQWPALMRFTPAAPIIAWRLARPVEGSVNPWGINTPWAADEHVAGWIAEGCQLDPLLRGIVGERCGAEPPPACLYSTELDAITEFVCAILGGGNAAPIGNAANPALEIDLIGPAGCGKRTLARQACATLSREMIVADAGLLLGTEVPFPTALDNAVRVLRAARYADAVLYWDGADLIDPKLWKALPPQCGADLMIFGASAPLAPRVRDGTLWRSFTLPLLDRAGRIALWGRLSQAPAPPAIADRLLKAGEIAVAARVAPAGEQAVAQACRQLLHRTPGELFMPLPCPYTWEDIVLAPAVRQHLAELEAQARLRWQVYEEWGFGKLVPLGRGITALFAGGSGTGKTMAAQVLAGSLGMDLYRIDLAGVVNKYIGETEKRLKQVFEVCERANVLLFFDEADALFGQRTQVKDAHDRYANIEIDYLLQRMEQFEGIAILATNRKSDIDPAFLRRLRFVIDFLPPGPAERLALWRHSLLAQAPGGESLLGEIDWDFLASKLTMTGAGIKSAALSAAFLARAAGARIEMAHVLYAAQREMTKHGVLLRPGEWQE
jgi:hypothetical protein